MQWTSAKLMAMCSMLMLISVAINMMALQSNRRGRDAGVSPLAMVRESDASIHAISVATDATIESDGAATAARPAVLNAQVSLPPSSEPVVSAADIVRGVQRELNARGYDAGSADGVQGLVTRAAILAYEQDYGLATLTAAASQDLLSRIVLGSSATSVTNRRVVANTTGEAEAVIRSVKQYLAALGYQPGKIDGALTPQLARAIREFEMDQKLPESSRISGPLVSRLMRQQGQAALAKPIQAKPAAAKPVAVKPPAGRAAQR